MTQFEYLSVLISILIGLGITQWTISWGRLLQRRVGVRFSALHAFWSIFILFLSVQFWWGFWNYRTVENWSLGSLLIIMFLGIALVFLTILLIPERVDSRHINLQDLYYENARPFFLIGAGYLAMTLVSDTVILGMPIGHTENFIRLAAIGTIIFVGWSTNKRLHVGLPFVSAAAMALFMAKMYIR